MHQTVSVIFEDPGVQELLVKLYQKGKIVFILQLAIWVFLVYAYNFYLGFFSIRSIPVFGTVYTSAINSYSQIGNAEWLITACKLLLIV